jgi:hypothetical protein
MFFSILLPSCSTMLGRFPGRPGVPDNSRFGGFNSRLGTYKFPFTSRREFSRNGLIRHGILTRKRRFCGRNRQIPGYFPGSREFAAAAAVASAGWSRRRRTPARCIAARDPRTTNARCRRLAPARQRTRAAAAADGCACAAYDRASARLRSSIGAAFPDQRRSHDPRAALGRQSRAKIPVPLADDRQNRAPHRLGFAPVAAATASFRDQAGRTFDPIGLQQPKHLTPLEPEQLPRRPGRQSPPIQILQHLEPPQLPIAHQPNRHPRHPPEIRRGLSFLTGTRVTF